MEQTAALLSDREWGADSAEAALVAAARAAPAAFEALHGRYVALIYRYGLVKGFLEARVAGPWTFRFVVPYVVPPGGQRP